MNFLRFRSQRRDHSRRWAISLAYLICQVTICFGFIAEGAASETREHGSFVLRVLSYNLHGLPYPIATDGGRFQRIGEMLKARREAGTAPHIVTIQEGFSRASQKVLDFADFPHVRKGAKAKFLKMNSGLRVLSEFPFLQTGTHTYTSCAGWDCFATKGIIFTQIQIPELPFPVDVYDTHMNSDPDTDPFTTLEQTHAARMAQAELMGDAIQNQSPAGGGSLVFAPGDFNFWVGDPDYRELRDRAQLESALETCVHAMDNCHAQKGDAPLDFTEEAKLTVDHHFFASRNPDVTVTPIFYHRNFTEKWDEKELSDHPGLEVHYRIEW